MSNHTATIGGKVYSLPPFTAGQMRRRVDPTFELTASLLKQAKEIEAGGSPDAEDLVEMSLSQRKIQREHAELVAMAIQNQYPKFTLDDLDDLTPTEVSDLFNRIMVITTTGVNEPNRGEAKAPAKRSR